MACNLYQQPLEASACTGTPGSSHKEKKICIMATGKRRNGIALLGGILIHKQENKKDVFWLLLSLVLTHFSEAVWFTGKHSTIQ